MSGAKSEDAFVIDPDITTLIRVTVLDNRGFALVSHAEAWQIEGSRFSK
jgi:hypothetical protein